MAESTAGIGEAGALINRATPPSTLDITRGLQMAENTALKKAQLEAARETKRQSAQAALNKYRTFKSGMYKDPSVNERAKKIAQDLQYEMLDAYKAGDMNKIAELQQNAEFIQSDLKIEDNFLSSLTPNNKKVDTSDILKAARAGKLNEYLQNESPLIQKYFDQDEQGYPIVIRPDVYNLDKAFHNLVSSLSPDYIDAKPYGVGKIKVKKKIPSSDLRERAESFVLNDEAGNAALDWNPEFRKIFKEEYGNNLDREDEAKINYVYNNLTKYNQPEYQLTSTPSQSSNVYQPKLTANGYSIGKNEFTLLEATPQSLYDEFNNSENRAMWSRNPQKNAFFMDGLLKAGVNVTKVSLPARETKALVINDPNISNTMDATPLAIYGGGKKAYLVYKDKSTNRNQIVALTPEILARIASYYGTSLENFIEINTDNGIDLTTYAGSGGYNVNEKPAGGGGKPKPATPPPTVTAVQYRAMSVSEKKSFKEKGGIVK